MVLQLDSSYIASWTRMSISDLRSSAQPMHTRLRRVPSWRREPTIVTPADVLSRDPPQKESRSLARQPDPRDYIESSFQENTVNETSSPGHSHRDLNSSVEASTQTANGEDSPPDKEAVTSPVIPHKSYEVRKPPMFKKSKQQNSAVSLLSTVYHTTSSEGVQVGREGGRAGHCQG